MQDFLPISVLTSQALRPNSMPDATSIPGILPASVAPPAAATSSSMQISDNSSDEQLILALRDGSEAAFTILFHRYKQPIFGFFSRRVADSARAEELTQETFIALFRAASRYEPRALFRTYLYAIAFRILRSDRRKSIFRAAFSGSPKSGVPDAVSSHTEDSLWIRRALAKLDPTDREIVMLREYQQLTYSEVATLLQIPLNTVRSRLFRARTALRELLSPQPTPPPSQTGSAERSPAAFAHGNAEQAAEQQSSAKKGDAQ
jgi:RNA polymerase sigma-70 factor (ECF subfamily)